MRSFRFTLAWAVVCALLAAPAPARSAPAPLGLQCVQGKTKAAALCGTFGVYEDRAAQSGRIIQLRVVVLKAGHPSQRAMAIIAGGPGQSAVELAPYIADGQFEKDATPLRDSYDILFMDDRGMGGSSPLTCVLAPKTAPALYMRQLFPDSLVKACRAKLAATHDLALYNANNSVDDLNDLRAALGYPKLVLNGGSYGTFFALVYMRRHPAQVESAVLSGVSPPGFQPLPGEPEGVQTALDDLIAKCKRDTACETHFPHFAQNFAALMQRFDRGPVPVTLKKGKDAVTYELSKEVFVDHVRQLLYDPQGAAYLPYIVERAAQGDDFPLGYVINLVARGLDGDLTMGAFLSYTCSEWMPFLDPAAVKQAAAHSFAADLRIEAQRRACSIWKVPAMPAGFNDPVRSDAPVLIVSGSDDPATPPKYADEAVKYLPNAKVVLVQGAGHAPETDCTDALVVKFVRAQSAKGLDTTKCSAEFTVPRFATSLFGLP